VLATYMHPVLPVMIVLGLQPWPSVFITSDDSQPGMSVTRGEELLQWDLLDCLERIQLLCRSICNIMCHDSSSFLMVETHQQKRITLAAQSIVLGLHFPPRLITESVILSHIGNGHLAPPETADEASTGGLLPGDG